MSCSRKRFLLPSSWSPLLCVDHEKYRACFPEVPAAPPRSLCREWWYRPGYLCRKTSLRADRWYLWSNTVSNILSDFRLRVAGTRSCGRITAPLPVLFIDLMMCRRKKHNLHFCPEEFHSHWSGQRHLPKEWNHYPMRCRKRRIRTHIIKGHQLPFFVQELGMGDCTCPFWISCKGELCRKRFMRARAAVATSFFCP